MDHFHAGGLRGFTPRLLVVEGADSYLPHIPVLAERLHQMVSFFGGQWT
ncbi:hypothetical protein [Hymenobacter sp. YC55]|nr:hypothetical protein [Hymenobacter sp. YC55]MDF7815345.1 hypothetical protein [Hymenobacter sp. YC55]